MKITYKKPETGEPYYEAIEDGPLRPIIVEADSYPDAFVQVLSKIAEQGKELANRNIQVVK
ncbi:MAG: hypothetical protein VW202_08190 [Halieaceae bacterium]